MNQNTSINSEDYWDSRFKEDWELKKGPQQSRFFAQIAINNLPRWLINSMRCDALTIADWGCAQGDGTNVWLNYLPARQVTGVDFSKIAIEQASHRYQSLQFINEDWLCSVCSENNEPFDFIFSSNTLEHFHNPFDTLQKISGRARTGIILALPFNELERVSEHFYSFVKENVPLFLDNGFRLFWSRVIECQNIRETEWHGEQIVLVYLRPDWVDSLGLTLADIEINAVDWKAHASREKLSLEQKILTAADSHEKEKKLLNDEILRSNQEVLIIEKLLSASNEKLNELNHIITSHETNISFLNEELNQFKEKENNSQSLLAKKMSEISFLATENLSLRNSNSWRITRPLRFTKLFFQNPQKATYDLAKFIFWRLPAPARNVLHKPRHKFIRIFREISNRATIANTQNQLNDLSWSQFNDQILSKRHEYKGIFIQELTIDWNVPLFQRPQHIAAAFGRLGYLVIYKTDNWAGDDVNGFREVVKNVWISNCQGVDSIDSVVRSLYSTSYANTPELLLRNGKRGVLVYEYIDHIDPQISGDDGNIKNLHKLKNFAFGGGVDFVVASAKKLEAEAVSEVGTEKVVLVQNGVDTRHYRDKKHFATELPENLTAFRAKYSKVVGYFGALAPWLWYDVINALIRKRQDIGFIFIGPDYYGGADKLPKNADNLLYMGAIDYRILPAYAINFDVCFIPFAPSEIARTTSPLKLFEYFALEKPVVVTSEMQECIVFDEVFRGNSTESLSLAIDQALLVKDNAAFKSRLATLADENNWDQRARAMEVVFQKLKDTK